MNISVKKQSGDSAGSIEVTFPVIENGRGSQAVHDAVVAYMAAQRMGTACAKTMGEVAGTGKKPWKQKGTGRARAGSFASPLWRGGGVTHGPRPRDFTKKISKKTRQLALRKSLSERLKAGDVMVVDEIKLDTVKTKGFLAMMEQLGVQGTCLIVVEASNINLELSARNVQSVGLVRADSLNTYDVLLPGKLVFTKAAFEQVQARLTAN